jgi:hypothetical protein
LIEASPPGRRPPILEAHAYRFRGRLDGDAEGFVTAVSRFREIGIPFWLAVSLLEHGELTGDESSLAEARGIFEGLRATPWLERLDAVAARPEEVPA